MGETMSKPAAVTLALIMVSATLNQSNTTDAPLKGTRMLSTNLTTDISEQCESLLAQLNG